jgi:hypothetical protein
MSERFECENCHHVLSSKQSLQKHLRAEIKKMSHKDDVVKVLQKQLDAINKRLNALENIKDDIEFKCDKCDRVYKNKYSLQKHSKLHHLSSNDSSSDDDKKKDNKEKNNFSYFKAYPVLIDKMGHDEAYTFVRNQMYRSTKGDVLLFHKIFLEDLSFKEYPVKLISQKDLLFSYLNNKGEWVDDMESFICIMRSTIQDCYLMAQIEATENIVKGLNNRIYAGHDIFFWQNRLSSYADAKYQTSMLKTLSEFLLKSGLRK